jgi:hypothetical protein
MNRLQALASHWFADSAFWAMLAFLLAGGMRPASAAERVSFRNEVMAVLSRAGCNQGTCHGNQNGKNGFKLSLRGEDPFFDWSALTRDALGRRANLHRPEDSLLLRKAVAAVPHEGGRRFDPDSRSYTILRRWLEGGMPSDLADAPRLRQLLVQPASRILFEPEEEVRLQATAEFDDGSRRDVTALAVFELSNGSAVVRGDGLVRKGSAGGSGVREATVVVRYLDQQVAVPLAFVPRRADFTWPAPPEANYIDRHVFAKLRALRMAPSELCADRVFLRRAYLDALGILPTPQETRDFLTDTRPDKRARLIDRLLERPEFADHWALKWSDLLRNEEKTLDRKGVMAFHRWIREAMASGQPLNDFARELIRSRGSTYQQPAANFYRALREPQVRAEAVAQVFLGIRLQCARCHNHPFDRWTQDDYHSLAAFFARVQYRIVENHRKDRLDGHEFDGEQVVFLDRESEHPHPRTGQPARPRFLGTGRPADEAGQAGTPSADRLELLADWVARPDNPFFARAQANRIWTHLMGRGIVDPNDDFRATNPPVNGPLLEALARDLAEHDFDVRHLVRTIMNSRTYQLSAVPNATNREDESNFSRAQVRPLPAEALLDALSQVCGLPVKFNGYPLGTRAGQLPGIRPFRDRDLPPTSGERFLFSFGKLERLLSCDCERADDSTLGQAFQLITGELLDQLLRHPGNRLGRLLSAGWSNAAIVEELYLAALCRPPSDREKETTLAFLERAGNRRAALEDLLWGLVNAKEFLLRQ